MGKNLFAFSITRVGGLYPSFVTFRKGDRYKPCEAINTSYTIRKKWVLYLLLEKNRAIACYIKALESRNGKCFRRVTEAVYGRARFRYGWKKPNKMHQKKLHSYCVLTVKTDPPMVLCRPYRRQGCWVETAMTLVKWLLLLSRARRLYSSVNPGQGTLPIASITVHS